MRRNAIVLMGASVGAVEALSAILPALPSTYGAAVVVLVHMGADGPGLLPQLFAPRCRLAVKEAEDKEPLAAGTIYFAPVDYHLLIERQGSFGLSCDAPVNFSRPSIDVLFESATEVEGASLAAVVLSGANSDGASGASSIERRGGLVLVQSPDSAPSAIMPRAAIELCPRARVLALPEIAAALVDWAQGSAP